MMECFVDSLTMDQKISDKALGSMFNHWLKMGDSSPFFPRKNNKEMRLTSRLVPNTDIITELQY